MDADLSYRRELSRPRPERDDQHLLKTSDPLADIDLLEELIRIVNKAQERDAEDERRLYDPMLRDRPLFFQANDPIEIPIRSGFGHLFRRQRGESARLHLQR